MKGAPEVN